LDNIREALTSSTLGAIAELLLLLPPPPTTTGPKTEADDFELDDLLVDLEVV